MRRSVAVAALLVAACFFHPSIGATQSESEQTPGNFMCRVYPAACEGGFADQRTVLQGDRIVFHIGNSLESFTATVSRFGPAESGGGEYKTLTEIVGLEGNDPNRPCSVPDGCDWEPTFELEIPLDWPSGIYRVAFPVKNTATVRFVDFAVAEKQKKADILVIADSQTLFA